MVSPSVPQMLILVEQSIDDPTWSFVRCQWWDGRKWGRKFYPDEVFQRYTLGRGKTNYPVPAIMCNVDYRDANIGYIDLWYGDTHIEYHRTREPEITHFE